MRLRILLTIFLTSVLLLSAANHREKRTFTVNGVSFTMVCVEGGTFTMGATTEQGSDYYSDELPTHQVTLDTYYIGETEVTVALWDAVMRYNPCRHKIGKNYPVDNVSWNDCQRFIEKLNALTGETFRLPTEAEWEFAARGGKKSKGYKYAGSNFAELVAWYWYNSGSVKHPVATKKANELGLYDMSGNVNEWCQDFFDHYKGGVGVQTNPTGPTYGEGRVARGGSWCALNPRVSLRGGNKPDFREEIFGLRLAL